MPEQMETCWLCLENIPTGEYADHMARHASAGTVMVDVKGGEARPVYVEDIDSAIDLAGLPDLSREQRQELLDLAAQSAGETIENGRYPASEELEKLARRLLGLNPG